MASLEILKNKIKSIETTQKITNAMKLVATANLKKQKEKYEETKDYFDDFNNIYKVLSNEVELTKRSFFSPEHVKTTYWVIVTSSLGLCGSFNNQIVKTLQDNIQPQDKIIVIGKKGYGLLKAKGLEKQIELFVNINPKVIDYDISDAICEELNNIINHNENYAVKLIYTKFINSLTFKQTIFNAFPMEFKQFHDLDEQYKTIITFQKDPEELLSDLKKNFYASLLLGAVYESNVSENASRRNSMDTATENADSLKNEYQILYNSTRQSKITQEINEIIGGSNGEGN